MAELPEFLSFGKIDDYDFLRDLGIAIESGSDSFARPADPKPVFTYQGWEKQDGIEYDLEAAIYKQARTFRLDGWLLADTYPEFLERWERLESILYASQYRTIYVKKYDIYITCRLKSFPRWEAPQGMKIFDAIHIGIQISIEFDEVMGVDTGMFLVDKHGVFLLTTKNEFITINPKSL